MYQSRPIETVPNRFLITNCFRTVTMNNCSLKAETLLLQLYSNSWLILYRLCTP